MGKIFSLRISLLKGLTGGLFASWLLAILGCMPKSLQPTLTQQSIQPPISTILETTTAVPSAMPTVTMTIAPVTLAAGVTLEPLPPEPQFIQFTAEDGTKLVGKYYPAAINPAPLIILFHWVRGNQEDWTEIAKWLQNRGQGTTNLPLPQVPENISYAVFTFDFRGFGMSALPNVVRWEPEGWLMDARASVATARHLPGVDPARYMTMGASIGGDAAIDVCEVGCLGALSLSPGGYLNIPYAEAVVRLRELPVPARALCLAAEGDQDSAQACRSATGDHYTMIIYPGNAHGMELIQAGYEPDVGEVILEFVKTAYEAP